MVKEVKCMITQGVGASESDLAINLVFAKSIELHTDQNYFLVFKPKGNGTTEVSDGNSNVLGTLELEVASKLYSIRDDYGDHYVTTLLLPEEY